METKKYNTDKLNSYNNPSFVIKMVEAFVKMSNEYLINITLAVNNNDILKVNQLAHHIKPSVDLLNVMKVVQPIREIEKATVLNRELIDLINFTNNELQNVNQQMLNDFK